VILLPLVERLELFPEAPDLRVRAVAHEALPVGWARKDALNVQERGALGLHKEHEGGAKVVEEVWSVDAELPDVGNDRGVLVGGEPLKIGWDIGERVSRVDRDGSVTLYWFWRTQPSEWACPA
jgi:hypothetical protein